MEPVPPVTVTVPQTIMVDRLAGGHTAAYWRRQNNVARADLRRARRAMHRLVRSAPIGSHWLERGFLCIHSYEGSWSDPAAPYWGGLQMDSTFQRTYGGEFLRAFGTADHWPISVQIAVGIRAYLSRGFGPWPNTRRMCGL